MYKVLIVDDEKPARETLIHLINWENTRFRIVDSAKNGKEALEKYEIYSPELIIVDIQMPVMDGLEFIREVRVNDKEQKFVILSCHENFHYAREAIKMDVTDYLLKDLLTPEDLYAVLEKVRTDLDKRRFRKTANTNERSFPEDFHTYINEYKNMALKSIVFENPGKKRTDEFIRRFDMRLTSNYHVLLCMFIDGYDKIAGALNHSQEKRKISRILNTINNLLGDRFYGECFYNGKGEYVALVGLEDIRSQLKFVADCHEISTTIRSSVERVEDITLTIGVSRGFCGFSEVSERYEEARNITDYKIFVGKGKTLFYNTILPKATNLSPEVLEKRLTGLKACVEEGNIAAAVEGISSIYGGNVKGFMQYNYLKHINSYMFNMIIEFCSKERLRYEEIFGCGYIPVDHVEKLETIQEISEWFKTTFTKIIELKSQKRNKLFSRRVRDAVEFIENNFNSELGLSQIADALGIHKGYLCRLFKQETGENLTDYILRFRIDKAKQLILATNFKLYEVAERTGFSSAQQFSISFKKVTGLTPIEFRDKNS